MGTRCWPDHLNLSNEGLMVMSLRCCCCVFRFAMVTWQQASTSRLMQATTTQSWQPLPWCIKASTAIWYDHLIHCAVLTTLNIMPGDRLWTGMIVQHTVLYWQPSWPYARGQIVNWYDCAAEDTKLYWHSCVTKCLRTRKRMLSPQDKTNETMHFVI